LCTFLKRSLNTFAAKDGQDTAGGNADLPKPADEMQTSETGIAELPAEVIEHISQGALLKEGSKALLTAPYSAQGTVELPADPDELIAGETLERIVNADIDISSQNLGGTNNELRLSEWLVTTQPWVGGIDSLIIETGEFSQARITSLYEKNKDKLGFNQTGEDWNVSTANVTSGFIENTGWHTIDASTFQVVDTDTDSKGITSISTDQSSAYIPSTQAYGQWEFDVNPAAASVLRVPIMSTSKLRIAGGDASTNGYYVAVSGGAIYLLRSTAGVGTIISQSANGTLTTGVWYRIKVTRTTAGVFTTYYSSDNGLNYTQMSIVAGSNPVTDTNHTTSKYTCIELATDFIIRNFRYSPVID